jgi:hypothetical protein
MLVASISTVSSTTILAHKRGVVVVEGKELWITFQCAACLHAHRSLASQNFLFQKQANQNGCIAHKHLTDHSLDDLTSILCVKRGKHLDSMFAEGVIMGQAGSVGWDCSVHIDSSIAAGTQLCICDFTTSSHHRSQLYPPPRGKKHSKQPIQRVPGHPSEDHVSTTTTQGYSAPASVNTKQEWIICI